MVPSRRGGARIPAPALVGRAAELACLLDRLEAARGSQGSVVLLVGEAGVGKSRLCQELIGRASESTACLYGAGSPCLPETELGPFVDALRGHLRELTPAAARELLGPDAYGMSRLLPELAELSPRVRRRRYRRQTAAGTTSRRVCGPCGGWPNVDRCCSCSKISSGRTEEPWSWSDTLQPGSTAGPCC